MHRLTRRSMPVRGQSEYSLEFRQLRVKVYRFYAHELQVLVHDRCAQLVRGKLEAEEERLAGFWRHGGGRQRLEIVERPSTSHKLRKGQANVVDVVGVVVGVRGVE